MLTHWVHSGDPLGKKISWLFFFPNGHHHAFIRSPLKDYTPHYFLVKSPLGVRSSQG